MITDAAIIDEYGDVPASMLAALRGWLEMGEPGGECPLLHDESPLAEVFTGKRNVVSVPVEQMPALEAIAKRRGISVREYVLSEAARDEEDRQELVWTEMQKRGAYSRAYKERQKAGDADREIADLERQIAALRTQADQHRQEAQRVDAEGAFHFDGPIKVLRAEVAKRAGWTINDAP